MENEQDKIIRLENELNDLKTKFNELFNSSTFPIILENVLIQRGFYNLSEGEMKVYREGGVGSNMFESKVRTVKYRNVEEIEGGYKPFIVDATTNIFFSKNHGFKDGQYLEFYNTDKGGAFPAPIAPLTYSYVILNSTQDTFQISTDGVNPVDITNTGTGTFYAIAY